MKKKTIKVNGFEFKFNKDGVYMSVPKPEKLNADITGIKVKDTTPKKR